MENLKQTLVGEEKKQTFVVDFSKLDLKDDFCDYDFKKDFLLSIRLSYGEEKQQTSIYNDYVSYLINDLKIIDTTNKIVLKDFKKSSSYYFIFRKNKNYDLFFNQLEEYLKNNKNQKLVNLLECKKDIEAINFTIANFEEKKDKIKNFVVFCKNQKLID